MGNAAGRLVQAPKPVILALRRWRLEDFSLCEGSLNYIARPYFKRPDEGQTWWCTPQVSMSLRPAWITLSQNQRPTDNDDDGDDDDDDDDGNVEVDCGGSGGRGGDGS